MTNASCIACAPVLYCSAFPQQAFQYDVVIEPEDQGRCTSQYAQPSCVPQSLPGLSLGFGTAPGLRPQDLLAADVNEGIGCAHACTAARASYNGAGEPYHTGTLCIRCIPHMHAHTALDEGVPLTQPHSICAKPTVFPGRPSSIT